MAELLVIANGKLQAGPGSRKWSRIVSRLLDVFGRGVEIRYTSGVGDATLLTRQALCSGASWLAAAGGDGTNFEVVNGFVDGRTNLWPDSSLSFIACGSGNDWVRTLGLPAEPLLMVRRLADSCIRRVDLGHVRFQDCAGNDAERVFLNVAEAGVGARVVQRLNAASPAVPVRGRYIWYAAAGALSYRPLRLELSYNDQRPSRTDPLLSMIVANGQYFGAGMRCAPMARPEDGQLEVITIGEFNKLELLYKFRRLINGSYLSERSVTHQSAQSVKAASQGEVLLELDGELVGRLPAVFSVLPGALGVRY